MAIDTLLSWVNLALLVVGFAGGFYYFGRRIGSLQVDVENVLHSIAAYMESHGRLLGTLSDSELIAAADMDRIKEPFLEAARDPINRLLGRMRPSNPITQAEAEKLREYTDKAHFGERFSRGEAEEFYRLAKKVEEEERTSTTRAPSSSSGSPPSSWGCS